jgi:outer membrane receptor protein involved in Fe transport
MKFFFPVFMLLVSTASFSQTEPNGSLELDSIVIKGSKEKKKYNETTTSITILKDDTYKEGVTDNSISALNGQSNVQVNRDSKGETFSIRGIKNTGVTGFQKDNLASIIIDDVFQTDLAIKAGSFDLWDMDRIEILRGAQSTTQGFNSLAGTILVNHNEPTFFTEGKLKLGYASFDRKEVGVATNQEIIPGKLTSRVAYNKETSDGFITNTTTNNKDWGYKNRDNFNAKLLYQATNDDKLLFDVKVMRNKSGGNYVQGPDPFKRQVTEDVDLSSRVGNQQASLRYLKTINENFSNTAILAYSQSTFKETSDSDGAPVNLAGTRQEDHKDNFYSLENLLYFKNEKVNNMLGMNISNYTLREHHDFKILFPIGGVNTTPVAVIQDSKNIRTIYSIFNSFTYDFNDEHSLNVGGRVEFSSNKYGTGVIANRTEDTGSPATNTTVDNYLKKSSGSYGDKEDNFIFLPKLGYVYHMNARNHFGAAYTEAYRSGGLSINRSRAIPVSYDPERTNNYELSHKYEQSKFNVSTNLFYTNWKHQQVSVRLSSDFYDTQVENASSSEVYGAEVQSNYYLTQAQTVTLNAGYVHTRFVDFKKSGFNYTGKEFPNAPNVTAMLNYKIMLTDMWALGASGRFLGKSFSNAENNREITDQYYFDVNTQYAFSSYSLELYVKNIFDKEYVIYDGSPSSALTNATGTYNVKYYQINTPRELGFRVNYFW